MGLNRKQIISLLILLFLVLILPLASFSLKRTQETRKKAQEVRKEIVLSLDPQTNSQANPWIPNYEQIITVKMKNLTSDKTLKFRVVGLELNYDPQILEVLTSNLQCTSPFSLAGEKASKVENNLISLVCYVTPGGSYPNQPQILRPGAEMTIGSFKIKVKPNSSETNTQIIFRRTNIPEEDSLEDLSKYGNNGVYYIAGSIPSSTPTPTLIQTPTPTVIPTPGECSEECPNGENGNLNCDRIIREDGSGCGLINSGDLTILLRSWSPEGPVPTPARGYHSADIVLDGAVNSGDLTKLLRNWKVE